MSIIQDMIALKEKERQRELADVAQISQGVNSFIQGRQNAVNNQLKQAQIQDLKSQIESRKANAFLNQATRAAQTKKLGQDIRNEDLIDMGNSALNQLFGVKGPIESSADNLSPIARPTTESLSRIDQFVKPTSSQPDITQFFNEVDKFGDPTVRAINTRNAVKLDQKRKEKELVSETEQKIEAEGISGQIEITNDLFIKSRKELSGIPNIGKQGVKGRAAGFMAGIQAKIGNAPNTRVFIDNIGKIATLEAKASGEQRPTDEDIVRFTAPLMSLTSKNDAENAISLAVQLKQLKAKGASVSWAKTLIDSFEKETGEKVDFNFNNTLKTPSGIEFTFEEIK